MEHETGDLLDEGFDIATDTRNLGGAILKTLADQNISLKNLEKMLLDLISLLGMSRDLLQIISRREYMDRIIIFAGMFLVTVFVVILYIYW